MSVFNRLKELFSQGSSHSLGPVIQKLIDTVGLSNIDLHKTTLNDLIAETERLQQIDFSMVLQSINGLCHGDWITLLKPTDLFRAGQTLIVSGVHVKDHSAILVSDGLNRDVVTDQDALLIQRPVSQKLS